MKRGLALFVLASMAHLPLAHAEVVERVVAVVNDDAIFLVIGDHFLIAPVREMFLKRCASAMEADGSVSCVRCWPDPGPDAGWPHPLFAPHEIGVVAKDAEYRISTSPAFFRVSYFKKIVAGCGPSAWNFEIQGSRQARNDGATILSVARDQPCPYPIALGLREEHWTYDSARQCREAGLDIEASVARRGVGPTP